MAQQFAKAPNSVHWKDWLLSHLFPVEFSKDFNRSNLFSKIDHETFSEAYETDGYDASDGSFTLAYDDSDHIYFNTLDKKRADWRASFARMIIQIATILGLPTRATHYGRAENTGAQLFIMSLKQFGKNLIGGWDSDPRISKEKKIWQWVSLPVKILIILPWKLISYPFKLLINGSKLLTEWLPLCLAAVFAAGLGAYRNTRMARMPFPDSAFWKQHFGYAILTTFFAAIYTLPYLILGTLHFAFRLIALIGRTITSPLKSARMAFRYGRELKVSVFGKSERGQFFNRLTSNFIGVLSLTISMSMTAVFWVIMLPAALVSAVSYLCTAYPWTFELFTLISQLPPVVAATTWFTPMVTATFSFLNPLGIALTQIFGTAMAGFSAFIGLQLSIAYTVTGSALALIAAFVAPALTLVGEVLSNRWATWTNGGPVTSLIAALNRCITPTTSKKEKDTPVPTDGQNNTSSPLTANDDFPAGAKSIRLSETTEAAEKEAKAALNIAEGFFSALKKQPFHRHQEGKLLPRPDFAELYRQEQAHEASYVSV